MLGKDGVQRGYYGQEINITTNNLCRINMFLHDVGFDKFDIACEDKAKIRSMLREISEIESIGDSCYNMARTISRKVQGKQEHFTEKQYEHMHQMFELTNDALTQMNVLFAGRKDNFDVNRSFNIENEINNYRNQLKSQNIRSLNYNQLILYPIV